MTLQKVLLVAFARSNKYAFSSDPFNFSHRVCPFVNGLYQTTLTIPLKGVHCEDDQFSVAILRDGIISMHSCLHGSTYGQLNRFLLIYNLVTL